MKKPGRASPARNTKRVLGACLLAAAWLLPACPPPDDTHNYAGDGDPVHTLLLAEPSSGDGPFPAVVYIHGGKWGEPSVDAAYFGKGIERAAGNGFVGVSINYRLTPYDPDTVGGRPWPAQLDDAKLAVAWLRENAERFRIDPDRIFVVGHSAGAHIALMMALTNSGLSNPFYRYDPSGDVQAVCSVAGPTHLLDLYAHSTVDDTEKMLDALIEPDPAPHISPAACTEAGCPCWFEGRCIDFQGICQDGNYLEDPVSARYDLAEASPLQNLLAIAGGAAGAVGHVPVLMIAGSLDGMVPEAYQHRPFFHRLDPGAAVEKIYPSDHYFTLYWAIRTGGIHDTAYDFFRSRAGAGAAR